MKTGRAAVVACGSDFVLRRLLVQLRGLHLVPGPALTSCDVAAAPPAFALAARDPRSPRLGPLEVALL